MEERITKEELLERLFHDDYENLKGKRLRLTRVRVPGKELSFAHVFTPSDKSVLDEAKITLLAKFLSLTSISNALITLA